MGKFLVVSVTLKGAGSGNFGTAREMLASIIGNEAMRLPFLEKSRELSAREKEQYKQLVNVDTTGRHAFIMPDAKRLLIRLKK
ncbi:hypothetical protein [Candidatus Merdisoma sp. JLR.KK006]|uniref:hypothetical protein n=1 Tax=Candidatus Merdisoma sp. JLR.KK006 TaxID=3112626 RepID=UPI002FF417EA